MRRYAPLSGAGCGLIFKQGNYTVWSVKSRKPPEIRAITQPSDSQPDPQPDLRTDTRRKILDAAEHLARHAGPGHMSLEAVAARAGVSKGGLLYHFPSKSRLMEALVEDFLSRFDAVLSAEESTGRPNAMIGAYLAHFLTEYRKKTRPPSGLLAALAEDPGMLDPVRRHERNFLDRIRANATDPDMATLAFLVVHAIRSMDLLNLRVLDEAEVDRIIAGLLTRLGAV